VRDGKVEVRQVKAGVTDGGWVEIQAGVTDGESVIARAAAFLRAGDRVRPTPETTAAND
jgi:HlyD family secretion protein